MNRIDIVKPRSLQIVLKTISGSSLTGIFSTAFLNDRVRDLSNLIFMLPAWSRGHLILWAQTQGIL